MVIYSLLRWWYGEGLLKQLQIGKQRVATTADYFSIALLAKTLFSPFRQISAGNVRGPIGVQLRAWLDRLVSRMVGATIRSFTIIAGLVALGVSFVMVGVRVAGWAALPVLPALGLLLALGGVMPWTA